MIQGIELGYGTAPPVLRGLDLHVDSGELVVMLGPSGCGKTTALRLVAGFMEPSAGDVLFDGASVLGTAPEHRNTAMVFQEHALFPFRTVAENIGFGLRVRKVPKSERPARIETALEAVQLEGFGPRWPDELSGGQHQRVALARALAVRPRLLLLDEPLSNLDPNLREDLRDTICTLQRSAAITTLLVTHDRAEARETADRVAIMIGGRIRQVGPPAEVFGQPIDAEVAAFLGVRPEEGPRVVAERTRPDDDGERRHPYIRPV